ncbi:hypothetical protein [Mesorhizobium sp. B3-1-7]|nr:hypothetical protein [Mesorhizobium sp. B3-1-7]
MSPVATMVAAGLVHKSGQGAWTGASSREDFFVGQSTEKTK